MLGRILLRRLKKWVLAFSVTPIVIIAMILKYVFHIYGFEVIPYNPLLSGLIAANIFLLGFLISGVLMDYKESERLPGDLAASLLVLTDDTLMAHKKHATPATRALLEHLLLLANSIQQWFYRQEHTEPLMQKIAGLSEHVDALTPLVDGNALFRMKQEQNSIQRNLIRIRTIRGTYFVPSGYAIAEAVNILVILGLLVTQLDTLYDAIFFVGGISFLTTYMLLLIRELDNPFEYSDRKGIDEVSLLPLDEVIGRLQGLTQTGVAKETG